MLRKLALGLGLILLAACGITEGANPTETLKVGVVIDAGTANDRSFNEYAILGAQTAATEANMDFDFVEAQSREFYEQQIETLIADGSDLVVTVGFQQGQATARAAQNHPNVKFAIIDNAYFPGVGCPETVTDCYTAEGGLSNVTSLMFAEDQVSYLAGVLAACVSETGVIASVAGMQIPPVVRFVTGFENGARSVNPNITVLNHYIPDFNDPATGELVAQDFFAQDADVVFAPAGSTGNGALLAASEAGIKAIGVDVDQYFTYPEVQAALITSAAKNVDVATAAAVRDFAAGTLEGGIRTATLESAGVGLAPYHEWDDKISDECKMQVEAARAAIIADPTLTGAE